MLQKCEIGLLEIHISVHSSVSVFFQNQNEPRAEIAVNRDCVSIDLNVYFSTLHIPIDFKVMHVMLQYVLPNQLNIERL